MAAKFQKGEFVQHKQGEFCVMMTKFWQDCLGGFNSATAPRKFKGPGLVVGRYWLFGWTYKVRLQNDEVTTTVEFIEEELEAASA